ncbi:titin isoform X2 [Eleginops maclovinus]|uniref:titin isoform X2 n=1 Tax=Eleginops maclovinus TaxID=56733 RepID=UPI003080135E
MSNRDSLGFGELLPQDVVDIFAQEKHSKRGRKKRSHSLGRALVWLKGKKKKNSLGLGPALDLALDGHPAGHQGGHKGGHKSSRLAHLQAVPKRDDNDKTPAPPLLQENVFIEASRPEYLENLHTEALEGLKMMQQEETNNGMEFQDNLSTISNMTDGEGGGFMTDSTIADSSSVVSVQSSVSTRSSRSGLTRQGSTFRPLNSGKKSEKTRTRRKHRKTVGGIPQHVQRELGLDRVGWSLTQRLDEEHLYNGESDDSPTYYRPQHRAESQTRAGASHQDSNLIHPLHKHHLARLGAPNAGHRDDLALLHCLGPELSDGQRPHSMAVPGMTTSNSLQPELPSPVMSMSPQAAYMSKIIPNAVLPPSIDVVEISRGRSRNSVRTVSKSSLVLSSPASSRASSRASSSRTTSSRASTITSASRNNRHNMSDSSCWSNSESSDTLVSDSSTISSSSTPRQKRSQDGDKISVHSSISKASKCNSNGKVIVKGDEVKKEAPFSRSLSVMKPKRAPLPPSRTYSLNNKMKRRSRDLAEVRVNSRESSLNNTSASGEEHEKNKLGSSPSSPGYTADTSSLDDSTGSVSLSPIRFQARKAEEAAKVVFLKDASEEKGPGSELSKIVSPSSGYSSQEGTSAQVSKESHSSSPRHKRGILGKLQRLFPGSASTPPPPPEELKRVTTVETASPSVRALRELFNIPPPPKVHAPPPPPPEVWAHSKRSFELLLGPPAPDNLYAIIKRNPKDRRPQRQSPSASAKNLNVTVESINGALRVLETKKGLESGILSAEVHKENGDTLSQQNVDLKGKGKVTEKTEKVRAGDIVNSMLVKAVEKREGRLSVVREESSTPDTDGKTNMDTLATISLPRITPSPSPPPAHHPPQPRPTSVVVSPEVSWPPPPPPMAKVGLNGPDNVDFPLPPPPMFGEVGFVLPVQVPPKNSSSGGGSSCTTTSLKVVITDADPQNPSTHQGPPPLNIPPPPPYMAPPPPVKVVSPPTIKNVSSPPKQVTPPPPKVTSPLPKSRDISPLPPPKETSPPPPPKEVSSPPPLKVTSPPPKSKDISPPPPAKETSHLPPPTKVFPPPSPKNTSPRTSPKQISPQPSPKCISPPSPPKEVSPTTPKEITPPPLVKVTSLAPEEVLPAHVNDVSVTLVTVVSPPPVREVSTPPDNEDSPQPPEDVSSLSTEEVSPPSGQEKACQSTDEATPAKTFTPPLSIPPPPALPSDPNPPEQELDLPRESTVVTSETNSVSSHSVLTPPQSIPPPPPIQLLHHPQVVPVNTDDPATKEAPEVSSPPEKAEEPAPSPPVNILLPPPLPGLASIKEQHIPVSTETQTPEPTSAPAAPEGPSLIVSPSLLQMVKLRSVSSSPEPPKAQEPAEAEVTMRNQQPNNPAPTSSASGEAPQKPIRRSLIILSPPTSSSPSASPPPTVTEPPALPQSHSALVLPACPSPVVSPMTKSPPAMTASPSMNLQEAIRLRTAARSKASPASRLSLHSPTSPKDPHKSPSSTASFIFSKSNKRVVIETKPAPEDMATIQKVAGEAEWVKKEVKVPPPVARRPKTKGKEIEDSEGTEQTAGQEALQDSGNDATEKTNGTAGTVEGGETPST